MDAIIYRRQSKDDDGNELAVDRQGEDAVKLAELRGWNVVATITDNDLSASGRRTRPGFEQLLELIATGKAGAVIAWDMTRISRNRPDLVRLLEVGEKRGITIALVRGSDLDLSVPAGQLVADIMGSFARNETKVKADRQRRAALQAAQAGKPYSRGQRAFGYERDAVTIREPEAAALRRAYDDVLRGVPLGRIARDLNERGLFTPQQTRTRRDADGQVLRPPGPSRWTAQTLRPVLLNPRYAGLRARTVRPERGRPTWEVICQAVWPAVVAEHVWRAAGDLLGSQERRTAPRSGQALLTGVALCGIVGCDSTVHGGRTRGADGGYPTYRCRASTGHIVRAQKPVDDYIGMVVVERLSRPDAADLLIDDTRPDVDALRAEAAALRTRRRAQARLHADGDITDDELAAGSLRIRQRLAEIDATLADAGRVDLLGPLVHADDVAAAWKAMDTDRRRAVVDALMTVRLLPPGRGTRTFRTETVAIDWIRSASR